MSSCVNGGCRRGIDPGWAFCPMCGEDNRPPKTRGAPVPSCQHSVFQGASFCAQCGQPFQPAVTPPPQVTQVVPFVGQPPPPGYQHLAPATYPVQNNNSGMRTASWIIGIVVGSICLYSVQFRPTSNAEPPISDHRSIKGPASTPTQNNTPRQLEPSQLPGEPPKEPLVAKKKWDLGQWQFTQGQYLSEITGDLTYNGEDHLSYAQITFDLLDASGRRVGSALDNINNLRPGEVWHFKAVVFENSASTARVSRITGF